MNKNLWRLTAAFIFGSVVMLCLLYGFVAYQERDKTQEQEAASLGYQAALTDIIREALKCQPVPITYQNVTINLFAVECVQKQEAGK